MNREFYDIKLEKSVLKCIAKDSNFYTKLLYKGLPDTKIFADLSHRFIYNNISSANKRKLFSTQHGMKQAKKKNISPLEIVVPYTRSRRERFYFWPPLSLLIQNEQEATIGDSEVSAMKKSL